MRRKTMQRLMGAGISLTVRRHRAGVGVVVFNRRGRLLLLKHVFHPQTPWGIPSGWLHRAEQPEACARRELHEETGLRAEIGPPILVVRTQPFAVINIFFIAYALDEQPDPTLSYEILEARWFDSADLPRTIRPETRRAIQRGSDHFGHFGWRATGAPQPA